MNNSAKILLLGKTGVGKSSFINYFLGKNVAKAAAGKPVTQEYFIPYEFDDGRYPIIIYDTKGLEALGANRQLEEIIRDIKKRNNSDDIFNWFHTIFYCVSMSIPRFEDFEVDFIRKLQEELSQHIHIIITHCDACPQENVENMRRQIKAKLGSMENIEIFEVVCVSMKKRNGQVVEPKGKEEISERVFDLLLEDIAHKLSCDYAKTLSRAWNRMVNRIFSELDDFWDRTIKLSTLFNLIADTDTTENLIDEQLENVWSQLESNIAIIQNQTDEQFNKILEPVAQLYTSYRGIVTDTYADGAGLAFSDVFEWCDDTWLDMLDFDSFMGRILPRMGKYVDENGDLPDNDNISFFELIGMIGGGIGDLFSLKKNIRSAFYEMQEGMLKSLPSEEEVQQEAYERIIQYMRQEE